jgi:NAD(P)-dependent dehydrogenase (short-subunit alcohol dehydrogenase family)
MGKQREVVAITGASAGIGRAAVREFARRRACIGLIARDRDRLQAAKREVEELGGEALALSLDVADAEAVENAALQVESAFGPLDIWINNAMATVVAPLIDTRPDEFKRATEVIYLGFVYGTMAALKRMMPRNHGTIVQVGSGLAFRSIPFQSAYCGAKHAIVGFTDSLRSELIHAKSKVRVTAVHPAGMNTPQFSWCRTRLPRQLQPFPPIYEPEVTARAVYWAAHHKRREVFVGAPTPAVIYGQNLAPGLGDWYLGKTGFESQQTSEPVDEHRPDNLFEPVPGNFAARGVLSEKAVNFSLQSWMSLHRGWAGLAAGALAGVGVLLWKKRS